MMRLAIATSKTELPPSDHALLIALAERGFDARAVIWSDARQNWQEFDAVVVRSCWDYHLRVQEFLAWITRLERSGTAVLNSPDLIRWNANKTYLTELAAGGISIPYTIFVESGTELNLRKVCDLRGWPSAVVKPTISASAHGTERRYSGVVRGPAMVQQYISAIETAGEWSLVYFNHQFSHAVNKKPRLEDFRVQAEFGGTVEAAQPPRSALTFAEAVLNHVAWPSVFARIDLIQERTEIWLMELEVIEPELFLDLAPGAAGRFAAAIHWRLKKSEKTKASYHHDRGPQTQD